MVELRHSSQLSATPLLIGVTGHRDPHADDIAAAEAALYRVFSDLRQRLPDTPLRIVCGMADGADRIVVRVALRHRLPVTALLPMPLDEYTADFSSESLAEIQEILAQPGVERVELPIPTSLRSDETPLGPVARDALYHRLAECLARKSNLVLALWDGVNTGLVGGTSQVLLRFLHALPEPDMALQPVQFTDVESGAMSGPDFACWIPMRRAGNDGREALPAREQFLSGDLGPCRLRVHHQLPAGLAEILGELNDYNSRFLALAPSPEALATLAAPTELPAEVNASLIHAAGEFAKADYLAVHNQRRADWVFQSMGWLAVIMGLLFLVYAKLWALPALMYGYVAAFLVAIAVTRYAHRRRWFSRQLMYRVIAETLRTRFFLSVAGVSERVNVPHLLDVTGISHFSGFSWISYVLRAAEGWIDDDLPVGADELMVRLQIVRRQWIESQARYFRSKILRLTRRHHWLERIKVALLVGLAIMAACLLLFKEPLARIIPFHEISLKSFVIFLMGFLPLALGVWEVYQQKMAVRELLWQYRNQSSYFSLAERKLGQVRSPDAARNIIENLGHKCLVESMLWAVHRYHREHEPAAAG
ncbi:MAG: hypothetical protein OEW16_07425 [Gammaproteobacteria bacterium]|nr:hypothetical protein [Gammaproteobacteria bacterium]